MIMAALTHRGGERARERESIFFGVLHLYRRLQIYLIIFVGRPTAGSGRASYGSSLAYGEGEVKLAAWLRYIYVCVCVCVHIYDIASHTSSNIKLAGILNNVYISFFFSMYNTYRTPVEEL